mmetsp:Transcript_54523/g.88380  ORF Transcript_54523/g.88380 Transcript_54523/m.88380 type:complete len:149 (+) Transcript_54523:387-833(+)
MLSKFHIPGDKLIGFQLLPVKDAGQPTSAQHSSSGDSLSKFHMPGDKLNGFQLLPVEDAGQPTSAQPFIHPLLPPKQNMAQTVTGARRQEGIRVGLVSSVCLCEGWLRLVRVNEGRLRVEKNTGKTQNKYANKQKQKCHCRTRPWRVA